MCVLEGNAIRGVSGNRCLTEMDKVLSDRPNPPVLEIEPVKSSIDRQNHLIEILRGDKVLQSTNTPIPTRNCFKLWFLARSHFVSF